MRLQHIVDSLEREHFLLQAIGHLRKVVWSLLAVYWRGRCNAHSILMLCNEAGSMYESAGSVYLAS